MSAASGPLNTLLRSPGSQYLVLGLGAYVLLAPDKMFDLLKPLTDAVTPRDNSKYAPGTVTIIRETVNGGNGGDAGRKDSLTSTIVTYTVGAGCVWVSYTVLSNLLPDAVNQLLPVTRRVFDRATKNLATSIFQVKQALEQQLDSVMHKQDDLGLKQDELSRDVKDVQTQVRSVGRDVSSVVHSVNTCQLGIEEAERLQTYTARGVKLLVTAVSSILPGDNRITRELADFTQDGEAFRRQLEASRNHHNVPPENEHPRLSRQSSNERIVSPRSGVPTQLEGKSVDEILALVQSGHITIETAAIETVATPVYARA